MFVLSASSTPMKNSGYLNVLFVVLILAGNTNNAGAAAELQPAEIKDILRESIELDKQSVGLVVGIVDEHGPRVIIEGKLDNGTDREVDGTPCLKSDRSQRYSPRCSCKT